jgi:two-component system phosphate regulon sensor histidine kinase PhoR
LYFNAQFAAQFVSSELLKLENGLFLKDIFRWPELVAAFKQTLKSGQTQRLTVQLNTLLDEKARFFAISIAALRKPKTAEIYGGIGIFHDITELKRSEQIRIDFVGNASHELRTPLTSLKGYVETLKEDFQEKNFSHFENFLNILSTNVDRLIDLVNDLLTISSLESHPDLRLELIEPLQLTENVVNEFQALANEKKQMIQVSGQIPAFKADAGKIEQILRNLISNAIKYIPEYKQITILWEALPDASIVLKVKDNGPGIPKEHHDRLFERFYRIDKGRARDAGGTGLGLSIVKHIVQSHKGQVKMFSDPENGGGTEFICIFPRIA